MNAIVMVDNNGYIGANGELLYVIPEDKKYFKKVTFGQTVIMGRKTFESLPDKKPLPDRRNVVLTHDLNFNPGYPEVEVIHSISDIQRYYDNPSTFIIGGASLYKELVPLCHLVYITRIDASLYNENDVDTVFPYFDKETTISKYPSSEYFWELFGDDYLRVAYYLPKDIDDDSRYVNLNGERVMNGRVDGCNFMVFRRTRIGNGDVDKTEFIQDETAPKNRMDILRTETGC